MNPDMLVSAAESADYGLTPARVRRWSSRKAVVVRKRKNKRPLYRLGDLLALEEKSVNDRRRLASTP